MSEPLSPEDQRTVELLAQIIETRAEIRADQRRLVPAPEPLASTGWDDRDMGSPRWGEPNHEED